MPSLGCWSLILELKMGMETGNKGLAWPCPVPQAAQGPGGLCSLRFLTSRLLLTHPLGLVGDEKCPRVKNDLLQTASQNNTQCLLCWTEQDASPVPHTTCSGSFGQK